MRKQSVYIFFTGVAYLLLASEVYASYLVETKLVSVTTNTYLGLIDGEPATNFNSSRAFRDFYWQDIDNKKLSEKALFTATQDEQVRFCVEEARSLTCSSYLSLSGYDNNSASLDLDISSEDLIAQSGEVMSHASFSTTSGESAYLYLDYRDQNNSIISSIFAENTSSEISLDLTSKIPSHTSSVIACAQGGFSHASPTLINKCTEKRAVNNVHDLPLVYTVDTDSTGFKILLDYIGEYDFEVDWDGDDVYDLKVDKDFIAKLSSRDVDNLPPSNGYVFTHKYPTNGEHTIKIRGRYPALIPGWDPESPYPCYSQGSNYHDDNFGDITELVQWGTNEWRSTENMFLCQRHMIVSAKDTPNFSQVTNMASMFYSATLAEPYARYWDTSRVKDMSSMFAGAKNANPDVSQWNLFNVTNISRMFSNAENANPDVSRWNTSNVTKAYGAFCNVPVDVDINYWDVSKLNDPNEPFICG